MRRALFVGVIAASVFMALQIGVMSQQLLSVREVLNRVWDKANHRLMTTPWVGAQQVFETETTILNDVWDSASNMLRVSGSGGGGGDFSSNTATSVDGEAVVFSGTDGKVGKRFSGTGLVGATSGVLGVTNLSGDVTTSGGVVTTVVKVDGVTYPASPSTNSIPLITAANTAVYKVIPDCDVAAGFLNYDTGTQAFTCGAFVPGSGDVSAVGSCTTGECFTAATPTASLTFNNATSGTVTLQTVTGALGTVTASLPAASDTLVGKATVDVLTNKTFNVESTGNVLTTLSKVWLPAASCVDTSAVALWDVAPGELAVATCVTGTETTVHKGVLAFPDAGFTVIQLTLILPDDWVAPMDLKILWQSPAITGSVVWAVSTKCVADGEDDTGVLSAAFGGTDVTKGTANLVNVMGLSSITVTGCAGGELFHLQFYRDGNNAADTLSGPANLIGVELTMRRAQ